jgi:xanthosine phosphorylase
MNPLQDSLPFQAFASIRQQAPNFNPKLGFILGSGSSFLAQQIQNSVIIPYENILGMRKCLVEGHCGELILGTLNGIPVICFSGRNHVYEGHTAEVVNTPIRIMKLFEVEAALLISAAGALAPEIEVGSLALVKDHLNFLFFNPLVGPNEEYWGPRFPDLSQAYSPKLRQILLKNAQQLNIKLPEAVYLGALGPSFETPAEIKAFRILGADVVGMSTVPEVIAAAHCGLSVAVICMITNKAAGLTEGQIDHRLGLEISKQNADHLVQLVYAFIESIS